MRGTLISVFPHTWRDVWAPLSKFPSAPNDLFVELFREFAPIPKPPIPPRQPKSFRADGEIALAEDIAARDSYKTDLLRYAKERGAFDDALSSNNLARKGFQRFLACVRSEPEAVRVLERSFTVIAAFENESFQNRYYCLVDSFLNQYSVRYDLRRPFSLHTTLPGIFAALIAELKTVARTDAAVHSLLIDFEEAVRDLGIDATPGRIKSCIQKQFNLSEALAKKCPGVTANTLGDMCKQLERTTWPHPTVRDALKTLYGLRSDYPGIGHGSNSGGAIRELEIRDFVALSVLLAGFVPYISHELNLEAVYNGS